MGFDMRFLYAGAVGLFIQAAVIFGFPLSTLDAQAAPDEKIAIQFKWFHQFQFAGYYAAKELGYFAEEGLDVELREYDASSDFIEDVVSGRAEYGIADTGLLLSRLNGEPVVLVSQFFQHSPLIFVTLKESGLQTPFDLEGKKLMTYLQGSGDAPLRAMVEKALGSYEKSTWVDHSFSNQDLIDGKVDAMLAYSTNEPFWFFEQGKVVNLLDPRDYGIDFYSDNLFTSEQELKDHPERVKKVQRAALKGWKYALENPDHVIDLIQTKYNSQKKSLAHLTFEAREIAKLIDLRNFELGHYEPTRYQKIVESYQQLGLTDQNSIPSGFFLDDPGPITASKIQLTDEERAWIEENPVIRVHNESDWPPFNFVENGEPQGYSIDYMNLLAKRVGIKVEYVTGPTWNEFLELMKSGDLDVMLNIVKTPERQKYLLYTPAYANNPNTILSHEKNTYKNIEQLFGKTVSLPKGFFYEEILERDFPQIEILPVKNMLESMKAVSFGEADAALGELAVFTHLINQHLMTELVISGELDLGDPELSLLNIATHKDLPILASILSKGVTSITKKENLELQQIWFGNVQKTDQLALPERTEFSQIDFIIQYIAIALAIILAVAFFAWLARGRPKQLTIRELLFVVFSIYAALVISIGTLVTVLLEGEQEQSRIEVSNREAFDLALELKQSSDNLTQFARAFSVTGDPVYETYYNAVIAIRDGVQAHPKEYTRSYWDSVIAGNIELDEDGEAYSIEKRMLGLGLSAEERKKLFQAKRESDALIYLENVSMNAVHERNAGSDGGHLDGGNTELDSARQLLHGVEYRDAKARIMKPIDDFFILLEWRTADELNLVRQWNKAIMLAITTLAVITIVFSFYAFFLLKRRIISPLLHLEAGALTLKEGDYSNRVDITSKDEVGTLAQSFNSMASRIEERTADLEQSEAKTLAIVDSMWDGVVTSDVNGQILSVNQSVELIFGYQASELIGKSVDILMPEPDHSAHNGYIEKYLKTGKKEIIGIGREVLGKRKDGSVFALDLSISEVKIGNTRSFTAVVRDISARKEVEAELRELSQAVEQSPVTVVITDVEGTIRYVNPAFTEVTGYSAEEAIGKNPNVLNSGSQPEEFYKELWNTILAGETWRGEFRNRKKSGELFWESASIAPIMADDGTFDNFLAIKMDITERKRIEAELSDSEQKNRRIFDTAGEGIWIVDLDNIITEINETMREILGRPREEIVGRVIFDFVDDTNRQIFLEQLERRKSGESGTYEIELSKPDGTQVPCLVNATPMLDDAGERVGSFAMITDFTEQKAAEEKIKENEGILTTILDNMPAIVFLKDVSGRFIRVNRRYQEQYGPDRHSIAGKTLYDIFSEEQARALTALDGEVLTGNTVNQEHSLIEDGHETIFQTSMFPVMNDEGELAAFGGVEVDITERKRAEEELSAKEALLKLALDNMSDGLFVIDRDMRFKLFNDRYRELVAVGEDLLYIGSPVADLTLHLAKSDAWGEGDPVELSRKRLAALANDQIIVSETGTKDGKVLETRKTPLAGGGCVGVLSDITERKQAEAKLREGEERLVLALKGSDLGSWDIDFETGEVVTNARWAEMLGYEPDEIGDMQEVSLKTFHPEDRERVEEYNRRFSQGDIDNYENEYRIVTKQGETRWQLSKAAAVRRDETGKPLRLAGTVLDITERKRAEEEVREARDAAEAATRSKAAFLAAMSHEIRTPMNGVVGMISLLQETRLESDQRTMMNTVQDSAFSLLQIINDILDFSKIEAGKMSLEKIPVNLDTVMEGVTETLLPTATKKKVRVALFIDPDIPEHVLADQVRLRQILFNLAGNAVKFTNSSAECQGIVTLRAYLPEPVKDGQALVRLSVIDNGIGMKPEAVDKLFTPFTQADQSTTRRFGGTGLGLSICKTLTELMGGECDVQSTEGEGSTFSVTLPFEVAEQADDYIRTFDLTDLNIAYAVKFDDTAEAVERYVTKFGATASRLPAADIVANVKEQAKSDPFDIVVLGTLNDDQDRDMVIAALRADNDVPGPRFVVLSGDRAARHGMVLPDMVVVESSPVRKSSFLRGVAMAAGRASPDVDSEAPKLGADARTAPEVEEARAAGELILVAEDNLTNQDVIRRQLNVLGYACEMADDGVIALDMLKSGAYGMLLTDCHMPNMDGYALTGALRDLEMDSGRRLPVVAITANALQGEAERCLAAGMDDYLSKPLEMPKLKAMLARRLPVDHGDVSVSPEAEIQLESAPTSTDGRSVVNLKVLTDMFGQDMDLIGEIVGDFIKPSRDIIGEIDAGVEARNADAVGKAGHKLKSSSRAIGADALADICAALEQAGKGGDWDGIEKFYPDLHSAFDDVVSFIEDLAKQSGGTESVDLTQAH